MSELQLVNKQLLCTVCLVRILVFYGKNPNFLCRQLKGLMLSYRKSLISGVFLLVQKERLEKEKQREKGRESVEIREGRKEILLFYLPIQEIDLSLVFLFDFLTYFRLYLSYLSTLTSIFQSLVCMKINESIQQLFFRLKKIFLLHHTQRKIHDASKLKDDKTSQTNFHKNLHDSLILSSIVMGRKTVGRGKSKTRSPFFFFPRLSEFFPIQTFVFL